MSLFNTIVHDRTAPARGFSPRGIGMLAAGLVLAVAVGYAINSTEVRSSDSGTAIAVPLSQRADFIYWNTTGLERPVPAASVAGAGKFADGFIHWNTTALGYPIPQYSERWNGPR